MSDERSPMDLDHLRPLIQAVADARRLAGVASRMYEQGRRMKSECLENYRVADEKLTEAVLQLSAACARADG